MWDFVAEWHPRGSSDKKYPIHWKLSLVQRSNEVWKWNYIKKTSMHITSTMLLHGLHGTCQSGVKMLNFVLGERALVCITQ